MYRRFFQILNIGVIRNIIPSRPLRAKEVEVFCIQIETFNQNLGHGSLLVNSNACLVANSHTTNDTKNIPLESKDGDGSLSHRQSLSLKKEKPIKSKPTKET